MNPLLYQVGYIDLLWVLVPVLGVLVIYWRWSLGIREILYALVRMVLQLILIGYALIYVFAVDNSVIVIGILVVMLAAASIITLRPVRKKTHLLYLKVLGSIAIGGMITLVIVTQGVVGLDPWYQPRYLIPLAGMILASAMNAVSIAAERFEVEINRSCTFADARAAAFQAALIPVVNSLFAVGLVSLPGMMTGQILSGVSPLVATRYQIMVMCMIFGSAGISCAIYLIWQKKEDL